MSLTLKEKELVAVGNSVAAGCRPCTNYHMKKVKEAEATAGEIRQAIEIAAGIRRSAAEIMMAHGVRQLGDLDDAEYLAPAGETSRIEELIAIGAAFAVNCTSTLKHHLKASGAAGISQDEVVEVAKLARFIKDKAASHVEKLVPLEEAAENESTTHPEQSKGGQGPMKMMSACCG
jgi:AhpD family alkylhydroperoxidase